MIQDQMEDCDPEVIKGSLIGLAYPSAIQVGEVFESFSCWYKLKNL